MRTVLAAILFLASFPAAAQQPGQPPAEKPPEKCTLEGQVVKAGSGEPLKKARLALSKVEGRGEPVRAVTGADGRFLLEDIEPGRYRLYVERNGYVGQEYSQRQPNSPGAILTLLPGQRLRDLVFKLIPAAVVAGRVYDEDGEPVPGAMVQAHRYGYDRGRRQLFPAEQASTDDRGEYRLFGLAPGSYYISATYTPGTSYMAMGRAMTMRGGLGGGPEEESYAPTYYPGTNDPDRATAMDVRGGDEVGGVDILLLPMRAVRIRGRVFNAITGKPGDASVHLFPRKTSFRFFSQNEARVDEQGRFEIRRVTPGSNVLTAQWFGGEEREIYVASLPLEVGDTNMEGIELVVTRGVEVSGRLRVEGAPATSPARADEQGTEGQSETSPGPLKLTELHVAIRPPEGGLSFSPLAAVKKDGTFSVKNLSTGEHRVSVGPQAALPGDYYLKSARLAGDDVLEEGLTVAGPVQDTLELVLSAAGGRVDGVVLTEEGKPFSGARVVLVPDERRRKRDDLFKTTATDQYGRFSLRGIAPGDYQLYAWENIEPGAQMDSEFLRRYEKQKTDVRVREGDRLAQELTVIPAEDAWPE